MKVNRGPRPLEVREKIRTALKARGIQPTEEARSKALEVTKGRISPMRGRKHSLATREKIRKALIGKCKSLTAVANMRFAAKRGSNSPLWRGGLTPIHEKIRHSSEYYVWRKAVLERDGYRCLDCGETEVKLQADHIYPFAYYPRLRFDIFNGRALCVDCHKKTPTYGRRMKAEGIYQA